MVPLGCEREPDGVKSREACVEHCAFQVKSTGTEGDRVRRGAQHLVKEAALEEIEAWMAVDGVGRQRELWAGTCSDLIRADSSGVFF